MAVVLETTHKRFRGLSTDQKPGRFPLEAGDPVGEIPVGSVFTEEDTGARYIWTGSWPWVRQEQTIEPLLAELIAVGKRLVAVAEATHRGHEEHGWERDVPIES